METKQKTLTLKDIDIYSERWNNIKREVEKRVDRDFNFQQFENVRQILTGEEEGYIGDNILEPNSNIIIREWINYISEEKKRDIENEYKDDTSELSMYDENNQLAKDFIDWIQGNYQEEIYEYFREQEHYPMWNTLFEAKEEFLSDKLGQNHNKIYEITGGGVIDGGERFNNMLFMTSAGHDFYESYWMPLYCEIFEWINVNEFEGEIKNGKK